MWEDSDDWSATRYTFMDWAVVVRVSNHPANDRMALVGTRGVFKLKQREIPADDEVTLYLERYFHPPLPEDLRTKMWLYL
jgi:hypothetical protein